jgi:hypothetical protein
LFKSNQGKEREGMEWNEMNCVGKGTEMGKAREGFRLVRGR